MTWRRVLNLFLAGDAEPVIDPGPKESPNAEEPVVKPEAETDTDEVDDHGDATAGVAAEDPDVDAVQRSRMVPEDRCLCCAAASSLRPQRARSASAACLALSAAGSSARPLTCWRSGSTSTTPHLSSRFASAAAVAIGGRPGHQPGCRMMFSKL
jgi:hypothetical protein